MRCWVWLVVLVLVLPAAPAKVRADGFLENGAMIADYDAALRTSSGRVDIPTLVAQLRNLNVDTYFYLIWSKSTDWDDLKLFLPAARAAGINVWAYLVPPTESPPHTSMYSEPYQLDYVRWGEEIARLSLEYDNLKAFVIDDFYANRSFFTPTYVKQMRDAAQAVNPKMRFFPLMYYPEMDQTFLTNYRDVIDGVVAAYPADGNTIQQAWDLLHDRLDLPAHWSVSYPGSTPSSPGDFLALTRRVQVLPADQYQVRLEQEDNYNGSTSGYHFKQLLIDGQVVWEEDVAGGDRVWKEEDVDVTSQVKGKTSADVTLRVYDKKGVYNFGVTTEFQKPTFEGLKPEAGGSWTQTLQGRWTAQFDSAYTGHGSFQVPLVVMTAASRYEYVKRWGEPGGATQIRDKARLAIQQMRLGYAEGVVTFALPKTPGDSIYTAVQQLFLKATTSTTADFNGDGKVDFSDFLLFAKMYGQEVGQNATLEAAYDLDLNGVIGFEDFLILAKAYGK